MQVLAHPDPHVLEAELLDRIAAAQAHDPLVPTARLAEHVRARLAQRLGACLGVRVLHHRALVLAVLEHSGVRRRVAPRPVLRSVLSGVLRRLPENEWSAFAARRPTAVDALLDTMVELREAGMLPQELAGSAREAREGLAVSQIYAGYVEALHQLAPAGIVDDAALVREACASLPDWGRSLHLMLHHGAYDVIGMHLELVRALDTLCPVLFLLPAANRAPAYRRAVEFARRHLLTPGSELVPLPDHEGTRSVLGAHKLTLLWNEDAAEVPPLAPPVPAWTFQGAGAELRFALQRGAVLASRGTPPAEIAVIARSLVPYAPVVAAFHEEAELALASSASRPLRGDPLVQDVLVLLRAVVDDFPRRATVHLLRSRRIRWDVPGRASETWTRKAGLVGGLDEWIELLPAWAAGRDDDESDAEADRDARRQRAQVRLAAARRVAEALGALAHRLQPSAPRPWSEHAAALEHEVLTLFADDSSAPPETLVPVLEALEQMRLLERLADGSDAVPLREAVDWLERALDDAVLPLGTKAAGGLAVLDAMQARGLTFDHLHLAGLHEGSFPRRPSIDPILPDELRRTLRDGTGRPLAVRAEGADEERILLALVLGSARARLSISWQRSDEQGRARSASPMLREVARAVLGAPRMAALVEGAEPISAHPAAALAQQLQHTGALTGSDAVVAVALRSGGPEQLERIIRTAWQPPVARSQLALHFDEPDELRSRCAALAPGLQLLVETESFDRLPGRFDARGIAPAVVERLSVSALETLARCPLQYFLRSVLQIREMEPETGISEMPDRIVGLVVHEVLERAYSGLIGRDSTTLPAQVASVESQLEDHWQAATADAGRAVRDRLPALWSAWTAAWLDALQDFVEDDLARLCDEGLELHALEARRQAVLDLGEGLRVEIHGRLDRIARSRSNPHRELAGDYKTRGNLRDRVSRTRMLKGETLQAPLYAALLEGSAEVELLGVGPAFAGLGEDRRRPRFRGFVDPEIEAGFTETLRVLVSLAQAGSFPASPDRHCGWCAYRRACRHNHPPTLERERTAEDARALRAVRRKSSTRPALDDAGVATSVHAPRSARD